MSKLRPGLPPEPECVPGALPRPVALLIPLLCLALGACSTTGATPQATSYYRAPVTGMQTRLDRPPVEIEDDGMEAQLPPRRRVHLIPDDPSQPYSPNYGGEPDVPDEGEPAWQTEVKPASVG